MYPQARYSPSRARGSRIHPKVEVLSVIVFFVFLIRLVPWARFREGRVQGVALSATTTSGACIYVCLALFLHCQHLAVLYSQYNWVRSTRVTTSKTSGFTLILYNHSLAGFETFPLAAIEGILYICNVSVPENVLAQV
jgi:hypothetical protein